ncbi:phospho-N-acetylmuramoyl-pentapeptide-transferase [Nocardia sp. alder85J]|uniref:phospho-N-acetylmuramoyl-pentapeptide- transferase n=1 Tax=Nocardia sp. alder85J TaxID=2862949 RepID=UPI001CD4CEF3|nr:phospho-N-acetylmuramoyl-pentapeptide-transferase [Nocardia sp. alder85J]MCX4098250.1 phospho-N-acetylmuramoyl-pentapeptide-transferase [Nocardia sp. alder85J]
MRQILFAAAIAVVVSMAVTRALVVTGTRRRNAERVRVPVGGPPVHSAARDTPTMGGLAILAGIWAGYLGAHLVVVRLHTPGPSATGLLVLGLATALGAVGFLDDSIKIRKRRNLGLTGAGKAALQIVAAVVFGLLALRFPGADGMTPATRHISYARDIPTVSVGLVAFLIGVSFLVTAWSGAVAVTDGLDGLATGTLVFALGAYVVITFWQYDKACSAMPCPGCYHVRDPLDLALISAAAAAACAGFLWWNAAPSRILLGGTGSQAMGGLIAGLSITTHTELLMVIVGAVLVAEALSVLLQVVVFRTTRSRLFKMAPFHHHFELSKWAESTVVVRFWLLGGIAAAAGPALFFGEYFSQRR